jgi:SAM-dependent methyltransferase
MSGAAVGAGTDATASPEDAEVIWHDLECGSYAADLPIWRELAARQGSPILELGAGTGRVTLELARGGHSMVALDRDRRLLAQLGRRAQDLSVETVVADARAFALERRFTLCLVPMQTVQLLGGAAGRAAMLACAARHLEPGGLLAIALSPDLQRWSAGDGAAAPLPDTCEREGTAYFSQPTAIDFERGAYVLERRRETVSPRGRRTVELDRVRLDLLRGHQLEREGAASGLATAGRMTIPATRDYVGSEVVVLSV